MRFSRTFLKIGSWPVSLETAPQPLDYDVVHPPTSAVHGVFHATVLEDLREGHAGELAVFVLDIFGLSWRARSRLQSQDTEIAVHHGIGDSPIEPPRWLNWGILE